MSDTTSRIGIDLIRGAKPIAEELGWTARQVFHAHSNGLLPTFKVGRAICARRSSLIDHIAQLERGQRKAG